MTRRWHRRVAPVALLCVLAGCATGSPLTAPATSPSTAAPTPFQAIVPTESPSPPRPVTLAFAGDVHFMGRTATLLKKPATAFGPISEVLSAADVTVLNLETAVTTRGEPEPKEFHFRAPASAYTALEEAGVDAVSLANNHVLDYGRIGLEDTLAAAADAGYPVFGAGRDASTAYAPYIREVDGVTIAVVGLSSIKTLASRWGATDDRPGVALSADLKRAVAAVVDARRTADVVVVYNHWGQERTSCPSRAQKDLAASLSRAGADVIVGSHTHTLQGAGWLGSTYVAYGLGNFVWYGNSASTDTGVLRLTVTGRAVTSASFTPAVVSSTGQPRPLTGRAATDATTRFTKLRDCTGLSPEPPTP